MYEIDIHNAQDRLPIDEAFLQQVVRRTLAEERVAEAVISVAVVDNAAIHELNRTYLDHDYETDVLSFLLESEPTEAGIRLEGEVVVSAEMAVETAAEFDWTPHDELVLYLVHGLLHLTGYDDRDPAARQRMRDRERAILGLWDRSLRDPEAAEPVGGPPARRPVDGSSGVDS
jgi:probable rRNA maturation factor